MDKTHVWPKGHWNWPISVTHKHGVRCGDMMWVGGQVNLTPEGEVLNPGVLDKQTNAVVKNIEIVLSDLGGSLSDLVSMTCFYVSGSVKQEEEFLHLIADALGDGVRTAITLVPVPYLAYENMLVEIECIAMRASDGASMSRQYAEGVIADNRSDVFCSALRCGKMIFVSAQRPVDHNGTVVDNSNIVAQSEAVAAKIERALSEFGADFNDVVKINRWYAGGDGIDDFEPAALSFAANFDEPGPAATGIPIPKFVNSDIKVQIAVIAMLGEDGSRLPRQHSWPESLWDWHVHLPYKHGLRCDNMIFLGGQVALDKKGQALHPNQLSLETHEAMAHIKTILNDLGADYDDVCKVMAVYKGDCGADNLHENLPIRSSYFSNPGPATTGVPLPVLAYDGMSIEIDIYAMADGGQTNG